MPQNKQEIKIAKGAKLSDDRQYRYNLWRIWDATLPACTFIALNPSTANEEEDDPTIRRCIRFAQDWGYGRLYMVNLFAFRAKEPKDMIAAQDPIGPDNNNWIRWAAKNSGLIVASWGNHGKFEKRDQEVKQLLATHKIKCFSITKQNQPAHPLYQKGSAQLIDFSTIN